jgi:cysteine desulfuration protein SufE
MPGLSKLQDVLDLFATFDDPADRTNLLLSYADQFREVPREVATRPFGRDHLVPHCESEAYVWALKQPDGTLTLYFAVENPSGVSAKALGARSPQSRRISSSASSGRTSPWARVSA